MAKLDENTRKIESARFYLTNKKGEPTTFVMEIESIGTLQPVIIIKAALEILKNKLEMLLEAINNRDDKVIISRSDKEFESYNFLIVNEDHTLGNLIETYLLDNPEIYYAGYIIPHPNDNKLLLTTSLKSNNTLENNKKIFISTLEKLIKLNTILIDEWNTAQIMTGTKESIRKNEGTGESKGERKGESKGESKGIIKKEKERVKAKPKENTIVEGVEGDEGLEGVKGTAAVPLSVPLSVPADSGRKKIKIVKK